MKKLYSLIVLTLVFVCLCIPKVSAETMEEQENAYNELLNSQLSLTPQTWAQLQANGVTEKTEIILAFMYYSPRQEDAEKLKQLLEHYDISIRKEENGELWIIEGKTSPTAVSEAILLQWVDYMVAAGWDNNCYFDGWGAEIPENKDL